MICLHRFAGVWLSLAVVVLGVPCIVTAQKTYTLPPPAPQADPMPTVSLQTIPRDELVKLYQAELGNHFQASEVDRLVQAHQLLENYFAGSGAERKTVLKSLEDLKMDPGILGRLTRIRMHWPALRPGVYFVNEKHGPYTVRYFLGVPNGYDRDKSWPLVIELPEPNAFVTQPPPNGNQVAQIYNGWMKDELQRHPDALVMMPLLDLDVLYGPSYTGMNDVMQPLQDVADRANVDPARVYMLGHSTSGMAVWNLALHYPTYFAAITALAGTEGFPWERIRLVNLRDVLPVVWQDTDDKVFKVEGVRKVIDLLKKRKVEVDYRETKAVGHEPTPEIVAERYQKMRARVRPLYPVEVSLESNRPEVQFNRNDWIQLWQEIKPGTERRLPFRGAPGMMTLLENSGSIDAKRNGNTIELTTYNVESMRIYLNDQMVDFSKPITVIVDRKKREGQVQQSVEKMLADQLALGRGWRYYTAVLDIDLTAGPATRPTTRANTTATKSNPGPTTRRGRIIVGPGAAD